jgi:hypothetical protein
MSVARLGPGGVALLMICGHSQQASSAGGNQVQTTLEVRHVSVSISRTPQEVYRFTSKVENLLRWATGLGKSIQNVNGEWIVNGPIGRVKVRFVEQNALGVLDHDVVLESGETVHNPVRVVPNGAGSEVVFSLFRRPGVSERQFAEDARTVAKDLGLLKSLIEN